MLDILGKAICSTVFVLIFVYMIIWSVKFIRYSLDNKRKKKKVAVRAKQKSIRQRTIACAKNYWYNIREVEDCPEDTPVERLYHYFETEQECIKALILEMYDCAIVRTEELERIVYGDEVPVSSMPSTMFDPYEVEDEYDEFDYDFDEAVEELMQQDDEEVAASAEAADDADLRAEIYDCWTSYVMQLYDMVSVNCNEEMKSHIRNKIMMYGHKDVEILIHSPE